MDVNRLKAAKGTCFLKAGPGVCEGPPFPHASPFVLPNLRPCPVVRGP